MTVSKHSSQFLVEPDDAVIVHVVVGDDVPLHLPPASLPLQLRHQRLQVLVGAALVQHVGSRNQQHVAACTGNTGSGSYIVINLNSSDSAWLHHTISLMYVGARHLEFGITSHIVT